MSKFVAAGVVVGLLIAGTILFTQFVSRKSPSNQASEKTVAQSKSTSQTTPLAERSAQTPVRGTPQVILQRYFDCFGERDPSAAYNLLSASFRSSMSFKKYSAMFSSTREIKVNETNLVNEAENTATVFVRFQETDADYHQTYWQGPIEFVREAGEWRIKTLRELKKVAAPEGDVSRPKINVATGPPVRTADKTWERPHVYLQLANESQRTAAVDLKRRLTQLGCDVVEIQSVSGNVDIPSATSELRYFSTGDAAEAQRLANEMQAFFGSTGIIVYLPEGMPYVSHSRQYEVWFSSAFH